jgi:hypothetical protein
MPQRAFLRHFPEMFWILPLKQLQNPGKSDKIE